MATTVDFAQTQVISVLRADMPLLQTLPFEVRELNLNTFRADLKDLEASNDGMPWVDIHEHTAPKTLSGVNFARVVEIRAPYTLTFEDGLYNVNVVGGNSNISDIQNKNSVGVNTANSAGLVDFAEAKAEAERTRRHMTNRYETDPVTGVATLYADDDVTPLETSQLHEDVAGAQTYRGQGAERRGKFS